jgi:hypothetical protein
MFLVKRYILTEKQIYDFQQWMERKRKCEEERRKNDAFMVIPPSEFDMWKKEQNYLNKWTEEQMEKGEVFKLRK